MSFHVLLLSHSLFPRLLLDPCVFLNVFDLPWPAVRKLWLLYVYIYYLPYIPYSSRAFLVVAPSLLSRAICRSGRAYPVCDLQSY